MKVPVKVTLNDKNLSIRYNGKTEEVNFPFKPFIETDKKVTCKGKLTSTRKAIDLFNKSKIDIYKYEYETPKDLLFDLKKVRNQAKLDYLNYIEQILVQDENFFTKYANTNELKIHCVDIEVKTDGNSIFPKPEHSPIICIGFSDMVDDHVLYCDKKIRDKQIISSWLDILIESKPDVLVGYYSTGFDIPFIHQRCKVIDKTFGKDKIKKYGLEEKFCKVFDIPNGNWKKTYDYKYGTHFDICIEVDKDQLLSGIKDRKMKTVGEWYNIKGIVKGEDVVSNTLEAFKNGTLDPYIKSDIMLTKELFKIYFPKVLALAELLKVPLDTMVTAPNSFAPKLFHIRNLYKRNYIGLEQNVDRYPILNKVKYEGAIVGIMNHCPNCNQKVFIRTGDNQPKLTCRCGRKDLHSENTRNPGFIQKVWKYDFKCVDDETEALTPDGWKTHNQLKDNDLILTWDPVTEELEFQPAKINRYKYNGKLIGFDNTYISFRHTPNHRVYYYNIRSKRDKIRVCETSDLPTYIEIPVSGIYRDQNENLTSSRDKYIGIIPWIITEGWLQHNKIYISQRESVNKVHCDKIRNLLLSNNIDFEEKPIKDRPDIEFIISEKDTQKILELMNNNIKLIPNIIFQKSYKIRLEFINDLINGDGHWYDTSSVFVQKNLKLIEQLQILCHITGLRATISDEYIDKRNGSTWYYLHISNHTKASITCNKDRPDKKSLYKEYDYNGIVWCPTAQNKTWVCRRNGKISITGNSMYPSSMITWNLSPETCTILSMDEYKDEYTIQKENNKIIIGIPDLNLNKHIKLEVLTDMKGCISNELLTYFDERTKLKKLMKKSKSEIEKETYNSQQNSVKVILNSILPGELMVDTSNGIEFKHVEDDIKSSISWINDESFSDKTSGIISHEIKNKKCAIIKGYNGLEVKTTADHSLIIYRDNNDIECSPNNIHIKKDYLIVPKIPEKINTSWYFEDKIVPWLSDNFLKLFPKDKLIITSIDRSRFFRKKIKRWKCRKGFYYYTEFSKDIIKDIIKNRNIKKYSVKLKSGGSHFPLFIDIDENICKLIGIYGAEGNARIWKNPKNGESSEVFIRQKDNGKIKELPNTIIPFRKIVNKNNKLQGWRCTNRFWVAFIMWSIPGNSYTKQIPLWIGHIDDKCKEMLINGWWYGDGCTLLTKDKLIRGFQIKTMSKYAKAGLFWIASHLGKVVTITNECINILDNLNGVGKREIGYNKDKLTNSLREIWKVKWTKNKTARLYKIKDIEFFEYSGVVYDYEVKGSHRFTAGNVPILVHNTAYGFNGLNFASYGDIGVAIGVTGMCRWTTNHIVNWLGDSIIEVDTDGLAIDGSYINIDFIKEVIDRVNQNLKNKIDLDITKLNDLPNDLCNLLNKGLENLIEETYGFKSYMILELEEFDSGYFYRAKNYCLLENGKIIKHGVSFKASSKCNIYDIAMDTMAKEILHGNKNIRRIIEELKDFDRYELEDFAMSINVQKPLDQYSSQTCLTVTIGRQAEEIIGRKLDKGDKIYYVKTIDPPYTVLNKATKEMLDEKYYIDMIETVQKIFNLERIKTTTLWDYINT